MDGIRERERERERERREREERERRERVERERVSLVPKSCLTFSRQKDSLSLRALTLKVLPIYRRTRQLIPRADTRSPRVLATANGICSPPARLSLPRLHVYYIEDVAF